ncbi:MAG TPA: oligopeptidase B, partial [Burkholderiaceae bacterium]|nr:oligopeptidase B [Burkholderiaceae bacterium]
MKTWLLRALLGMTSLLAPLLASGSPPLPDPPVAPRQPKDVSVHGERRIDDYHWLRDRDDPRVLDYLKAENAYTDAWLAPRAA